MNTTRDSSLSSLVPATNSSNDRFYGREYYKFLSINKYLRKHCLCPILFSETASNLRTGWEIFFHRLVFQENSRFCTNRSIVSVFADLVDKVVARQNTGWLVLQTDFSPGKGSIRIFLLNYDNENLRKQVKEIHF